MFDNRMLPGQNNYLPGERGAGNIHAHLYNLALNKFKSTLFKGQAFRLKSRVLNRPLWLHDLNALKRELNLHGSSYSGIQVVPISSIIGSEGRTADFDIDFHPLGEEARERWISMAIAHLSHLPLPPVQLIQVGEAYFVRDGHHRISVSRAFGQIAMDAEVITWKASPPFPWQPDAAPENSYPLESFDLSA